MNIITERVQPQQEWSEEDKKMFVNIKACLRNANKDYSREVDWLKSLRPQSTWKPSEEDENRINRLIAYFEDKESFTAEDDVVYANWLKSLKERYIWKPSDYQIEALESATENCAYSEYQDCLRELIEQLKKLKG